MWILRCRMCGLTYTWWSEFEMNTCREQPCRYCGGTLTLLGHFALKLLRDIDP